MVASSERAGSSLTLRGAMYCVLYMRLCSLAGREGMVATIRIDIKFKITLIHFVGFMVISSVHSLVQRRGIHES